MFAGSLGSLGNQIVGTPIRCGSDDLSPCVGLPQTDSAGNQLQCDSSVDSDGSVSEVCYYVSSVVSTDDPFDPNHAVIPVQSQPSTVLSAAQVAQQANTLTQGLVTTLTAAQQQAMAAANTITTKAQLDALLKSAGGSITVAPNSGALVIAQQGLGVIEYKIAKTASGTYQISSTNYLVLGGVGLGLILVFTLMAKEK